MNSVTLALGIALSVGIASSSAICAAEAVARPNIIFVLSDDVGLGDIGCTGGPFKTPRIDSLAQGGMRFEYCYSTPLCGPSRCQMLTGRYPFRTGLINNNSRQAIQPDREVMIPTVLKQAGYVTASVGKWGQMSHGPGEWGFDEYLVFPGSGRYWRAQTTHYTVNGVQKNLPAETYLPDVMHEFLADFLKRHKDQPFFVYYPMSHIHGPIVRTPDSKGGGQDRLYADNIAYMDKLVGKLLDELDRLHLREKTLVIFTGDNGTARFGVRAATVNGRVISGYKATMLEGGSRVPCLVNWPGVAPAGAVNRELHDFSDFFVTFAELAGAKLPVGVTLDGRSFAPQIKGQPDKPREWAYVELNGKRYVRDARWKLNNAGELFDLQEAPYVEVPVPRSSAETEVLAARERLRAVLDGLVGKAPANDQTGPAGSGRRNPASTQLRFDLTSESDLRRSDAPDIAGRAFTVTVQIAEPGRDGVLVAQGGRAHGWTFYFRDGGLYFATRRNGNLETVSAPETAVARARKLTASLASDGTVKLLADDREVAMRKLAGLLTAQPADGLQVGRDLNGAVGEYSAPFPFAGKLRSALLELQPR